MSIVDKFKNLVNPIDNDDDYNDDDYVFDGADDSSDDNYDNNNGYQEDDFQQTQHVATHRSNSNAQSQNNLSMSSGSAIELKVVRPKSFDAISQIADHLISNRTVVINLEDATKEDSQRMVDFLLGVIYTIDGDIKKVAQNTWVITPKIVEVSSDHQRQSKGESRRSRDTFDIDM